MLTFVVRTTAHQEQTAADTVATKEFEQIHAVLAPDSFASYVVVEAGDNGIVTRVLEGIPHARGFVGGGGAVGTFNMTEVEHFPSSTPNVEGIAEGDIVKFIAGSFRGGKARVQRIDETEDQIAVELYEATIPIPVTVRGDQIHVLDSEER